MQLIVEIPDGIAERLVPDGVDLARTMLEDRIAGAYREGRLTAEEVRQALGLATRFEVEPFLLEHEIYDYTPEMLEKDLEKLENLSR
jgi:hypothetical protein